MEGKKDSDKIFRQGKSMNLIWIKSSQVKKFGETFCNSVLHPSVKSFTS